MSTAGAIVRNNLGQKVDIYTNPVEQVPRIRRQDLTAILAGYTPEPAKQIYIASPQTDWDKVSDYSSN